MRILIAVLAGLLLVLQAQLWSGQGGLPEVWRLRAEIREQQQENARLSERNATLEAEVRDLKDGLEAVEERARSELGMIGEDEVFYQVPDP